MKLKIRNVYFTIEEIFVIFVFTLLLSTKIRAFFDGYILCFCFIIFHECAHMLVAGIFGEKLKRINIRLCGLNAEIEVNKPLHPKWIVIYSVGPVSNILLASMFWNVPIVRDINIGLGLINLLPIFPLDGFNILNILISWLLPQAKVNKLLNNIQQSILFIVFVFGIIILIKLKNISMLIFLMYIICLKTAKPTGSLMW